MKPVVASIAYLLISHGSRDPRPQEAMNRLANLVRKHLEAESQPSVASVTAAPSPRVTAGKHAFLNRSAAQCAAVQDSDDKVASSVVSNTSLLTKTRSLQHRSVKSRLPLERSGSTPPPSSKVIVGTACLELAPISLSEQIYEFGLRLTAAGIKELKLLPVFLMSGVHVMEDIPAEVAAAKELLGSAIKLTLCPYLGSHPKITHVLASRLASVPAEGSLLVAHGSRRHKGNKAVTTLAKQLDTTVAYWSVPPDIETQVIELMQQGCQRLTILPYFLFAGGITDAITHRTEELAERFPKINFRLLPTLGTSPEISELVVELSR